MLGLKNKTLLWKNAGQIIALLIIATQIICVELSVTDNMKIVREKQNKLTRPTIYQVSKVEIRDTEVFLQNIINVVSNASGTESVNISTTTCNTPLCSIKNKAEQLLDLTNKYIKNNSNKSDTYTVLHETHKKELDDLEKSLNDEIRHYIEDRDNQTEERKKTQTKLDDCLKKYEDQSKILLNTRINNCVAQLQLRNFENASELLNYFNYNDTMLAYVAEHTYDNHLDNLDTILQFLFENSKCDEETYTTLFENMKKNNHLHEPIVLRFYLEIDTCKLENLKKKVLPYCNSVIKAWGPKIPKGDDEKINDFANKWPRNSDSITNHIYDIVDKVYDNYLCNYNNTIKFLNKLSSLSIKVNGYSALLFQMTKNNHLHNEEIVELAILAKKIQENYKDDDNNLKLLLSNLHLSFPILIRNLIWNGICTIKNIGKNEYLYAANDHFMLDENTREIFTWIPGNSVNNGVWKFEPSDCSTCFRIKNNYWSNYNYLTIEIREKKVLVALKYLLMTVVGHSFNPSDQWPDRFKWKLIPQIVSNRNLFYLHNIANKPNQLLVALDPYDSERRHVRQDRIPLFRDINHHDYEANFLWELQCQ